MSEHSHGGASEAHADHHYEYDGKPANEPGPDEPATPGWLTLLGISLVLVVLLAFIATRPDGKTRAELTPQASGSAVPSATAPATANAQPTPPPNPMRAIPTGMRPALVPGAFASGAPRPFRPGQFAVQPGNAGGSAPPPQHRPAPPAAP
ncbi:MAG TPA: hypothetical protein VMI54_11255 [Polyangiaceae bacterium]|nr:hypothetical protein [Polyangiaceae bacterium]